MRLAVADMSASAEKKRKIVRKKATPNIKTPSFKQREHLAIVRNQNPTITSDEYALQFGLSIQDTTRLKGFALEYLKDFNATQAAMRLGYDPAIAGNTGCLLLNNCYTQILLSERISQATEGEIVNTRQVIAELWKEANAPDKAFSANAATRIKALEVLAKILRLGQNAPPPKDLLASSSGVMLVPMAVDPAEWGRIAQDQQKALKASTYIDAEIVS